MAAIITENYRINAAGALQSNFLSSLIDRNYYLFIGRVTAWTNENTPPVPLDSIASLYGIWDHMVSMKKITDAMVCHVLQRKNWDESGATIYYPYDHEDVNMYLHPTAAEVSAGAGGTWAGSGDLDPTILSYTAGATYVVTDVYNVYKCISNRSSDNLVVKSTIKPTGTSTNIIQTADGYRWKYMFTISASDQEKFTTNDWIPIRHLTADDGSFQWLVQEAAVEGEIQHIRVDDGGSGYVNVHSGTAQSCPDSTHLQLATGASGSNDVYNGSVVEITGGLGEGQVRLISDYVGSTKTIEISQAWTTNPNGSSTYAVYPLVTITGDGSGAVARVILDSGEITAMEMINVGAGYHIAEAVVSGGGGSAADLVVIISPPGGQGSNALTELGGNFAMVNVVLAYDEPDFPEINDYRILGIIADVRDYAGTIATAATRRATKMLTVSGESGTFECDELITSSGAGTPSAYVIAYDATAHTITYYQDTDSGFLSFAGSEVITGSSSLVTATISSVSNPECKRYTGDILYVEQRRAIIRAEDQTEDIKIVTEF